VSYWLSRCGSSLAARNRLRSEGWLVFSRQIEREKVLVPFLLFVSPFHDSRLAIRASHREHKTCLSPFLPFASFLESSRTAPIQEDSTTKNTADGGQAGFLTAYDREKLPVTFSNTVLTEQG